MQVSASAYLLLSQRAAGVPTRELARVLGERLGRLVTPADVEAALSKVDKQVMEIEGRRGGRSPFGLWVRVRCLPAPAVTWLARRLTLMLHPLVAAAFGATVGYMFVSQPTFGPGPMMIMTDSVLWPAIGLIVLSGLVHEFGHAAACARFSAPVGEIGTGFYWVYPVFFTNVNSSWRLPRRQRVVVDVAGSYFQLVVAAGYLAWWRVSGWEPARMAGLGAGAYALFVLLPLFRFDGYWLLSDGLGVTNLSGQVRRAFAHLRDRVLRRPSPALPWRGWVTAAILTYAAFTVLFLGIFLSGLALILADLAMSYPKLIAGLMRDLVTPPHRPAAGRLHSVLFPSYTLFGGILLIVAFGRRLLAAAGRRLASKAQRQPP